MARAAFPLKKKEIIEQALGKKTEMEICGLIGVSFFQLKEEIQAGWVPEENRYSAKRSQEKQLHVNVL